jgi:hypothetical protein
VKLRSIGNPATRYRSIELALQRHIIDQSGRCYVTYEHLDLRYPPGNPVSHLHEGICSVPQAPNTAAG